MRARSYYHGISDQTLIGQTIGEYFADVVRKSPKNEAIVSCEQNVRLTYEELEDYSHRLAKELLSLGVEKGDRVGIWCTNNYQWFVIFLAVSKVGAILVNVNPGYRLMELEYALKQSSLKLLFLQSINRSSNYAEMIKELCPHLFDTKRDVESSAVSSLKQLIFLDEFASSQSSSFIHSFDNCLNNKSIEFPSKSFVEIDDPVNIQYTSGTTGFPKGVTLSHHNIINNAYLAAEAMRIDSDSRFCVPMPFYHCGGMISSALATLVVGGTVVIPSPYFQEEPTLKALDSENCTHLSGVPTMFIAQLEHHSFSQYDLSSLRSGFMAGAPCPVELMREVADKMNVRDIVILYGLTESSPLMTATTVEDSLEIRSTTVGKPVAHTEVKVIDTESGEIVKPGEQGEICCRGHLVMLGYWNDLEATGKAIDKARWLHSGDLGTMDENGYINITGRKKDMIARGGENVYPREIEEVLHKHEDISQAQVFGVPDHKLGEEVALWVIPRSGVSLSEQEIKVWLKERIAHFKVPKYIKVVSEYPMTVTGKIRKFKMRESMIEELSLQSEAEIQTA